MRGSNSVLDVRSEIVVLGDNASKVAKSLNSFHCLITNTKLCVRIVTGSSCLNHVVAGVQLSSAYGSSDTFVDAVFEIDFSRRRLKRSPTWNRTAAIYIENKVGANTRLCLTPVEIEKLGEQDDPCRRQYLWCLHEIFGLH
ncbi:hypothetical protein ACOME3_005376 [Neoechinorhynchus agilis]